MVPVTIEQRLHDRAARCAYFFHACEHERPVAMCTVCGENTGNWCDACETNGHAFALRTSGQVMAGSPLCTACEADPASRRCRVCSGEQPPELANTSARPPVVTLVVAPPPLPPLLQPQDWGVGWRVTIFGLKGARSSNLNGRECCVVEGGTHDRVRVFEHEETFRCYKITPANLAITGRTVVGRITLRDMSLWAQLHHAARREVVPCLSAERPLFADSLWYCTVAESARRRALIAGLGAGAARDIAAAVMAGLKARGPAQAALQRFEPYQACLHPTAFAGWRARRAWRRCSRLVSGYVAMLTLLKTLRARQSLHVSSAPLSSTEALCCVAYRVAVSTFFNAIISGSRPMVSELLREFPHLARSTALPEHDGGMASPPLVFAVKYYDSVGSLEILRVLLDGGCEVDAADSAGGTALLAAALTDRVGAARLLLSHGADRSKRVDAGFPGGAASAYELAVWKGHRVLARLLR